MTRVPAITKMDPSAKPSVNSVSVLGAAREVGTGSPVSIASYSTAWPRMSTQSQGKTVLLSMTTRSPGTRFSGCSRAMRPSRSTGTVALSLRPTSLVLLSLAALVTKSDRATPQPRRRANHTDAEMELPLM